MKFRTRKINYLFVILLLALLIIPQTILAAEGAQLLQEGLDKTAQKGELDTSKTDLPTIVGTIVNYLFGILGVILLTVVLIGGYLWMTAGGNEEKVAKAKGFIINGINGMIVIFLAYALVYVIMVSLGRAIGSAVPE